MRCPRCGHTMTLDTHRKIPMNMCYDCGYIEGRTFNANFAAGEKTNFAHMKSLNFNEEAAFLAKNLNLDEEVVLQFLEAPYHE